MSEKSQNYGIMAEFENSEKLLDAAHRAYGEGYRRMDAYTPFPVEGLDEAIGIYHTNIPLIVFIGGVIGGVSGYLLQYWINVFDFPINVGGRPYHSWPAFIPVTFEMTILFASLAALIGMLMLNGLPKPYHPVFNVPSFDHATQDRFFLCIEAADPKFDRERTKRFLEGLESMGVTEVEP